MGITVSTFHVDAWWTFLQAATAPGTGANGQRKTSRWNITHSQQKQTWALAFALVPLIACRCVPIIQFPVGLSSWIFSVIKYFIQNSWPELLRVPLRTHFITCFLRQTGSCQSFGNSFFVILRASDRSLIPTVNWTDITQARISYHQPAKWTSFKQHKANT